MGARHGAARRRQPHRQVDPDLRARRAAALRRHQHLPQGALRGERPRRRQIRRGGHRHPLRFRHHLPARHALRPAGHPPHLGALHALQLRARRRSARADDAVRCRRRVHHPGQPGKELRPDHARRRARVLVGRAAADARRRPFDRLSLRARHRPVHLEAHRHHPFRPPHRHPGEGSRRAHAHHALVLGDQPAQRARRQPRAARHRRLAGAALRRGRGAQARHQRAHHRRHREDRASRRPPRSRSSWPGRMPTRSTSPSTSTASIAASCRAPAGPSPAASCRARRSSSWGWSPPKAYAASRWSRSRRPTTPPTSRRWWASASWSRRWARWSRTASSAATRRIIDKPVGY